MLQRPLMGFIKLRLLAAFAIFFVMALVPLGTQSLIRNRGQPLGTFVMLGLLVAIFAILVIRTTVTIRRRPTQTPSGRHPALTMANSSWSGSQEVARGAMIWRRYRPICIRMPLFGS